ncbi:rCG38725 [Rattus norvegicus]|uniref:RCG38725 n=1 Tax=Rattus norvegicus TaxID=10116 RepID=A6KA02_RAT|nr:rCG38725 [Rattus norvegicus]
MWMMYCVDLNLAPFENKARFLTPSFASGFCGTRAGLHGWSAALADSSTSS